MARRRPGDKPLSEPLMVKSPAQNVSLNELIFAFVYLTIYLTYLSVSHFNTAWVFVRTFWWCFDDRFYGIFCWSRLCCACHYFHPNTDIYLQVILPEQSDIYVNGVLPRVIQRYSVQLHIIGRKISLRLRLTGLWQVYMWITKGNYLIDAVCSFQLAKSWLKMI